MARPYHFTAMQGRLIQLMSIATPPLAEGAADKQRGVLWHDDRFTSGS
ncbi:MAG: hypothetical protein AB7P03_17730 [Kofleriaceae bacterium]